MSIATWPATVPFITNPDAFSQSGPIGNVKRTPMESGPVKTRRRFTAASREVSGETDIVTTAQVSTFEIWFRDTIGDGALPFTAVNPRTNTSHTFRFIDTYQIVHINDDIERLALKLEMLP